MDGTFTISSLPTFCTSIKRSFTGQSNSYPSNLTSFHDQYLPLRSRLQIEHQLLVALQDGLVLSSLPIYEGRVLDIVSAGGNFAVALSDEFPDLEVYSLDLTPS